MLIRGWRFLDSARINSIVRTLADRLDIQQPLIFLNRTPIVDADDDEIVGKFKGQVYAADIIADDQQAVVYEGAAFEFVTTSIPNLKIGQRIGQANLNRLDRLRRNLGQNTDLKFLTDWETTLADNLVLGIRQRINGLICAMQLDELNYDRLGVQLKNATWGMPADLKVTATGVDKWDAPSTSDPLTQLQVLAQETAPDAYGEGYNRVTMSSQAFRLMTATTSFQNRVSGELRYNFQAGQLNTRDAGAMRNLFSNITGLTLEIYDGSYWEKSNAGKRTRSRYLPVNKVLLSNTADDNSREAMDFANGVVTESVVSSVIGHGEIPGASFGPISYFTGNEDLNPPDVVAWGVSRGFPRKHRESCTAVLTAF